MSKMWSGAAVAVLAVTLALPVAAAEKGKATQPGGVMGEATIISSTVESIDYATREVTLKGPKGGIATFIAGDEVRNFNQVKKGDKVTFTYSEGVAVDVQKATEAPKMTESQTITRAKPGEKPAGTIETVGFLTARVDEIDYKTRKMKLALPEGQNLSITVGDQVKRLNDVHKGDEVVVQYKQKLAIKVTSPK